MIDLSGLHPDIRRAIQFTYAVYATGLALFVLEVTILGILDVRDIEITALQLGALGLALVGPMVPFLHKVNLPGGAGFDWPEPRDRRVSERLETGLPEFQARLSELDLNEVAVGMSPERGNG